MIEIDNEDLEWLMAELYPTHFNHKKYNEIKERIRKREKNDKKKT